MFTLYVLSFLNGKQYVGQTTRKIITRITQHRQNAMRNNSMLAVHCAWRAHGEPTLKVIGEYDSQDALNIAEKTAIIALSTLSPNGYNISVGGDTAPSKNPLVAAKISAKATGRKDSDSTRLTKSEAMKKRWQDPVYRENLSKTLRESFKKESSQKKLSERSNKNWEKRRLEGWAMSETTKDKMRNKVVTDETRAKMSSAAKGKSKPPRSEATRLKLSEAMKAKWQDEDYKKNQGRLISQGHKK